MASIYDAPDLDQEEAYKYAQLTPAQQIALRQRMAEQGVERGAENVARGALGLPQSEQQNREAAGMELKRLAQKVGPGTEEFYTQAAAVFRKHNMVAEAETMEQRRHLLEIGKGERSSTLMKMQRDRDTLAKRPDAGTPNVQAAISALDRQIAALGVPAQGSKAADPEFIRLLDAYEAAMAAGQGDRAALIKQGIDAWLANKKKSGDDMTPYQKVMAALAAKREDRADKKDTRKVKADEAATVSALQGTVRAIDNDLQSAERLFEHPGLPWITGARVGVAGRLAAAASSDAAGAHALLLNVQAQTFIKALQDLKATSRTGASGLGQLTEREGDKIQNAKVALDPQQPTDQFKRTLTSYIGQLKAARTAGASELAGVQADVPAPPAPVSDKPAKPVIPGVPAPAAAPKPRKFTSTPVTR